MKPKVNSIIIRAVDRSVGSTPSYMFGECSLEVFVRRNKKDLAAERTCVGSACLMLHPGGRHGAGLECDSK